MDMADSHQAGVVNLLADDPQRTDESLPRRVDVRRLRQERKGRFKRCRLRLGVYDGHPQTVYRLGTGGRVAELNETLRSDMQDLTASVYLQSRSGGNGVVRVRHICQPSQDAGIDQIGHQSYSPSLLRSSWDRATPQSD